MAVQSHFDVAIVGGGPAGSTVGALLKTYRPELSVAIIEREQFPRDHVGESHLPAISEILVEMGVWDKVEAADFPIKIGATYRWGRTDELWDFEFLQGSSFADEPRPAQYKGQRTQTAFQVDRSIYDTILLDHAAELGCLVLQEKTVTEVLRTGDKCDGLRVRGLDGAEQLITAKHYVDGSGERGLIRQAMGIGINAPTSLRNIALWDYWQDAEWAVTLGSGGTRIQVLSLGWGWIWFIPITATRTSVGLVLPAETLKDKGLPAEELYLSAIESDPLVSKLLAHAKREGPVQGTKDWNFLSDRIVGDNWFLTGDACGFADPILSAGMTLAHTSARAVAYSILALEKGGLPGAWLRAQYNQNHLRQIRQHMMFADYWYSANGRFTDLKEYCSEIAASSGLTLDADDAFRWLATGGFTQEVPGVARASGWRLRSLKMIIQHFSGGTATFQVAKVNRLRLSLDGAEFEKFAVYQHGQTIPINSFRRGSKVLPLAATFLVLHHALTKHSNIHEVLKLSLAIAAEMRFFSSEAEATGHLIDGLEALMTEGWVVGEYDPALPLLEISVPTESDAIHANAD